MEKELILRGLVDTDETELEICAWRKKAGERFEPGEIIVEIIAGKENAEVALDAGGTLKQVLKDECEIVSLDDPIAILDMD